MSKFKLNVYPAIEASDKSISFLFETEEQMEVAKDCMANLLLFIQDDMKLMVDYSNEFEMQKFINDEWEEYDYF